MIDDHIVQAVSIRWYNACAAYAVNLVRGLTESGRRVTLAGPSGSPSVERAADSGMTVCALTAGNGAGAFLARVSECRRFAREQGVTLVNVHDGTSHLLWTLALRGTGIPLIRTSGNQLPPRTHPIARWLMARKTAGVIVTCRPIQRFYSEGFGIPPASIPIINGGVDFDFYTPSYPRDGLRERFGLPDTALVFGILARFSPDKGHETFFRAAGQLASRHPNAWFLVAGWNAQLTDDDIRGMAQRAGVLDRTRFEGRVADNRDLIAALDAGVICSVGSETICRIAMEYMAMGLPVIGTDTNVIPEVIRHDETGIIAPAGDPDACAAAMIALADSPEKARQLGAFGRTILEREYTLPVFAETTIDAYRKLIDHG
jgi:glycosyltransferase involved in cell wall biosynthesis